jgi:DNA topoisomerase-3
MIETLIDRGYVARNGKQLVPTELGLDLVNSLPVPGLCSAELTGQWEARLANLARSDGGAERAAASFIADINSYVTDLVAAVRTAPKPPPLAVEPLRSRRPATGKAKPGSRPRSRKNGQPTDVASRSPAPNRGKPPRRSPTKRRAAPGQASGRRSASASAMATTRPAAASLSPRPAKGPPRQLPPPGSPVEPPVVCPRCRRARLLWGRQAWGCADFRTCPLTIPYAQHGRDLSESELRALCTAARAASRAEASKQ